ncbi:hypothetical protein [Erwinia persicina]|uniref:hypothetical protein n=1 Tax=Erwinia persicina TaxID=55211 RepID=UPI0017864B67|nr:hypothetical protein [Erwinia persicina]MBD8162688.1 hypothetical protein [Erwinia persicina]
MNYLRLIIDRNKHATGVNCAVDAEFSRLPVSIADAVVLLVPGGYLDGLTHERAEFIMRKLLRLLDAQPVTSTVTDHTQRATKVYPFADNCGFFAF